MTNNVFANGLEISCKVSDGKSVAIFPDPCWTPPPPPTGPLVIPFPNTAYAKHTKKGSKTVTIGGHEIMLKGKSFFKKSTGNEPATKAFNKGLLTRKLKGKAYFITSSMNVVVEGKKVVRHTDLTTHNHGSNPTNTLFGLHMSEKIRKSDCEKESNNIKEHCDIKEGEQEAFDQERKKNKQRKRTKTWKDNHCNKMLVMPTKQGLQQAIDKYEKMTQSASPNSATADLLGSINMLLNVIDPSVGSGIPSQEKLNELYENLKQTDLSNKYQDVMKEDECLKSQKCSLTSYQHSTNSSGKVDTQQGNTRHCCYGQTGHHLIPDAWAKEMCGDNYDYNKAPVVCVEGTSHSTGGSHNKIHVKLDDLMDEFFEEQEKLDISNAIKLATNSHLETFVEYGCSEECIKAQLEASYKDCGSKIGKQERITKKPNKNKGNSDK